MENRIHGRYYINTWGMDQYRYTRGYIVSESYSRSLSFFKKLVAQAIEDFPALNEEDNFLMKWKDLIKMYQPLNPEFEIEMNKIIKFAIYQYNLDNEEISALRRDIIARPYQYDIIVPVALNKGH